ncbi:MAG TPA: hypothetical protein VMF13_09335 [Luteitalea sp.]|nr:hypothetical protein [Luteitalea sp.]
MRSVHPIDVPRASFIGCIAIALCIAVLAPRLFADQGGAKPPISGPEVVAPPTWWRTIPMPDGRRFVTDGGISIDAEVVKPTSLPTLMPPESAAAVVRLLASPHDADCALGDLRSGAGPNTFVTPSGVILNGNYVTLLRSTAAAGTTRLRTSGKTKPVVIMVHGQAAGVMMPVQPPREP